MAGGRRLVEPRRLMRSGLGLIVLGHGGLALGAIVHGSVLRHVAGTSRAVTPAYAVANVVSVVSGLLSIAAGIVAILVSHNLSRAALHWALLSVSLLNCLLSAACSVGLALAFALTVNSRGTHLITGCNSSALPADARAAIATNDCPFNTTRIYDTALALWFPSMVLAATEAVLSGRCCLVALIFRGIGPCSHKYTKEQLAGPSTAKEGPGREMQQLLPGLAESCT
ncbi:keratinocyte-associated protein 3 [Pezoporus wallicus]|uniref:keratinocyte-associated protein 3 n=1 Tax=Pezoporus wallicus TaxID=35540 RepID=UPI00254A074A|nr:keratinocyte-associated protein 3 [Pezoporus wallicus]XP_057252839.1 keratinocyte-associated protein 3 [Pezoporus wallicus]XP_061317323.1 keratinocyte-associated protein 3 isoform X1 [Pezoporus flaviventris]XP_061317324.1 keratinocyte-associated protein 3 isoform X1 [Pezoporus flaviventris]